jgi:hypothetical protein
MWRKIQEVHPALAEAGKFIDWQRYRPWPVTVCNDAEFAKSMAEKVGLESKSQNSFGFR